ncbi:MAG: class B sortase [Lachnospiraceae bacterium]|nr:class B sortase [Lachnospiraceae bacterium]
MEINQQTNPNDPNGSKKNNSEKRHGSAGFIALSVALLLVIVVLGVFLWKKQKELNDRPEQFSLSAEATFSVSENTPGEIAKEIESNSREQEASTESVTDPTKESTEESTQESETPAPEESPTPEEPSSEEPEETKETETPKPEEPKATDTPEEAAKKAEAAAKAKEEAEALAKATAQANDPMNRVIDFATLQAKQNGHIYAWISVPGTNVDYPVLRHPTDDGYYLYHNLNGTQGYPGCIYTENCNSKDWTDPVTVLYGHDMRSTGTMFHQLHKFEKQDFFDKHEFFYVYTPDKTYKYQIFSAYVHTNEHLLGNHNFSNSTEFDSFFTTVLATNSGTSHVRSGVSIDSSSKIVALSTCIKNKPDNRYIIFGVLVN